MVVEANEFIWPGPDLRPVPKDEEGNVAYGSLPPGLSARVRSTFIAAVESQRVKRVRRTE